MIRRLLYVLVVLAIACTATWTASLLPLDPTASAGLCITAGSVAGFLATTYLPCPCHRKESR